MKRSCATGGPVAPIELRTERVFPKALQPLRARAPLTRGAIHLAVALDEGRTLADDALVFVTRDRNQADAATALGLAVA